MLKKICNHPELILNKKNSFDTGDTTEVCRTENSSLNVILILNDVNYFLGDIKPTFKS